jgi:hypothetical protein
MTTDKIIKQTEQWLTTFIIHYNICPFAKREHERKSIFYTVEESSSIEQCLTTLILECQRLDSQPEIETTLLIFPDQWALFDDYLDFLTLADTLLIEQGYEGIYQLASFHPLYCFEGEETSDPANYTNRSPYPMLHLIRESSLEHALQSYPQPELIPENNIKLTRRIGSEKIQSILSQILSS